MKYVNADFDEILFEDRVKDYGAYQMRKNTSWYITTAGLLAILLFLCGTALPKMISWISWKSDPVENEFIAEVVNLDELELPPIEEEQPEELKAPPPPIKTIEFKVPEPTPEDEIEEEETIVEQDSLIDTPDLETHEEVSDAGDDPFDDIGNDPNGKGKVTDDVEVEKDPLPTEFFGGEEPKPVNMDDLKKIIGYPPMAKEAEITGKVIVRVLVDKTGSYVKHVVLKDPHAILTKAVTDKLPQLKFTPGRQNNQPVKVWVTIPFEFKLSK
jgi:protein TonB